MLFFRKNLDKKDWMKIINVSSVNHLIFILKTIESKKFKLRYFHVSI